MKKLIVSIIVLAAVVIGVNYYISVQPASQSEQTGVEVNQPVSVVVEDDLVRYPGRDGANALELLLEVAEVEFQEFDFGVFVETVGGVKPDAEHFWKLYVNGEGAQVGASDLETEDGDVIEWRIEEINDNV